jgi:hypothetical protein
LATSSSSYVGNTAEYGPANVLDSNNGLYHFSQSGTGEWIKLSFPGGCRRVNSIVLVGLGFWMDTTELMMFCGSTPLFYYNEFASTLPQEYTLDTSYLFAPAPPVPAADELWVIFRHTMVFNSAFRIQELVVFAEVRCWIKLVMVETSFLRRILAYLVV